MSVGMGYALPESGVRETRWLTPKHIVDALGAFDLDPCGAPNHKLAQKTYLLENGQDGLVLDWVGRVWLNPPYGKEATPFLKRLAEHSGGVRLLSLLVLKQECFLTMFGIVQRRCFS